jgi:hypothetical protein
MSLSLSRGGGGGAWVACCAVLVAAAVPVACGSDDGKHAVRGAGGEGGAGGDAQAGAGAVSQGLGGEPGPTLLGGAGGSSGNGGADAVGGQDTGGDAGAPTGDGGTSSMAGKGGVASGGDNQGGAPPGDGHLRAYSVTAGHYNSFVVELGTKRVWAWGYQVDAITGGYNDGNETGWAPKPVKVQGLTDVEEVVMVSESSSFYARHTDGTVSAWGRNDVGQLGDQTVTVRPQPVKVLDVDGTPMRGVCSIAASVGVMIMARSPSCSPYAAADVPPDTIKGAWVVGILSGSIGGTNNTNLPSNGAIAKQFAGLPAGVDIASVTMPDAAANAKAGVLFFMSNGSTYAWGFNGSGTGGNNPLGAGTSTAFAGTATTAVDVSAFWTGVTRVQLGRDFAIARMSSLSLTGVGRNLEGQLGTGNDFAASTLVPVSSVTNVSDFSVGQVNAAAIVSGQLWAWGADAATPFLNPRRLGTYDGFTQVSLGDWHGLVIGPDHRVYVWGGRSYSALADGITSGRSQSPALLAD